MTRTRALWLLVVLILAACYGSTPSPTPLPLATPTPTQEPTPIALAPIPLVIRWPLRVWALEEVLLRVDLPGLAQADPTARVWARITDPDYRLWWESDLQPSPEGAYIATQPLHLPLEPPSGEWRLHVFVHSRLRVRGERTLHFYPEPVPTHNLSGQVPELATLSLPRAFAVTRVEGDLVAGGREWARAGQEVGLWWTPGPAEPLTQDTAQMMVEATYPAEGTVEVLGIEPTQWRGMTAYRFIERWPQGRAEALVVQGADHWLYLLRVRSLNGDTLPPLLRDIQATFMRPAPRLRALLPHPADQPL